MDKHDKRLAGSCGISLNEAARILSGDLRRHDDGTVEHTRRQRIEKILRDESTAANGRRTRSFTLDT